MGLLDKLFGRSDSGGASGKWSWTEHGAWVDLKQSLGGDAISDLKDAARAVAQTKGGGGFMSEHISVEPGPQNWGRTTEEFHQTFARYFMGQVQMLERSQGTSNVFGDFTQAGAFGGLIRELPAIHKSFENRTFKFIAGVRPDRCRVVGLLVFT